MNKPKRTTAKPKRTRAQWVEIARGFQRQTVDGLIRLGKTLAKAKADLPHGEWGKMLRDDLKLNERFAQRVMAIARNPRFAKSSNLTHLPTALSALAIVADMPDDVFQRAVASDAINPRTTAKQARQCVTVPVVDRTQRVVVPTYVSEPAKPTRSTVYRPPSETDRLIADLEAFEERLHAVLDGDRLQKALAGLAEVREALGKPSATVVPLPGRAEPSPPRHLSLAARGTVRERRRARLSARL